MKKLILPIVGIIVLIFAVSIVFKLIGGVAAIAQGLFNLILGVLVVLATIALVVWMISYAKRNRK